MTDILRSVRVMRGSQMGPDTGNMTTSQYKVKGASRSNTTSSTGQDVSSNLVLLEKPLLISAAGTLQMLGCIPQSPSPSTSPVPTNHINDGREQELRALRVGLSPSRTLATRRADKTVRLDSPNSKAPTQRPRVQTPRPE